MKVHSYHPPIPVAVDCLVFGFDGTNHLLLLTQSTSSTESGKWNLPGDFLDTQEDLSETCIKIIKKISGVRNAFTEQLHTYIKFNRSYGLQAGPAVTTVFITLIDMKKYKKPLFTDSQSEWFTFKELSKISFDYLEMVQFGKDWLRYKATFHPVLLELLPEKFTLRMLFALYKNTFEMEIDKRNFMRKYLSTGLLLKQKDKEKENSKKGAHFYKLHKDKFKQCMQDPVIVLNPASFLDTQSMQLFNHKISINSQR